MSTPQQLTTIKGGINRLRTKGAALQDSLYDLLNGYVTERRTVVQRPGTVLTATLTAGTKGLTSFQGEFHVFAAQTVSVPDGFVLHVLSHPDAGAEPIALDRIYFAEPFMGFLYVVAGFEGYADTYYHYWLQTGPVWEANHVYRHGDIVAPSVANGFAYQASRISAPSLTWAPGVLRAVNDVVEPTVYNDYTYTVVTVEGTNPRSGDVEPDWPTEDGAQVEEAADGVAGSESGSVTEPPDNVTTPNPETEDRYENYPRPPGRGL
jgi:hypothetical protein